MKKIIFINIIAIIIILFSIEIFIWAEKNIELNKTLNKKTEWLTFFQAPLGKEFTFIPQYFPRPENGWGRAPEGLEYTKKPIVLFGCSYTYGIHLNPEQTFSYKLAQATKRPVYNRAWQGWGIQHMLEQTTFPKVFESIPEPEYIIYTYIDDHIRRLYISHISAYDFITKDQYLNYELKNEKLIKKTNKNKIKTFISNTYIAKTIREYQLQKFINNKKFANQRINFALKHFIESKKNIENYWKDTKFIVFFYDNTENNKILRKKLEKNGFITISSKELTKEDLTNSKYSFDNHPTEAAWDLLTPLIAEKLNSK